MSRGVRLARLAVPLALLLSLPVLPFHPPDAAFRAIPAAASGAWTVYHHDDGHTGYDPTLPPLSSVTTGWVSGTMDAQVYAEPLIYNGIVYAATLNNTVYAFRQSDGVQLWSSHLGAPTTIGWLCGNVAPMGILGTPVIDATAGRIYAAALLSDHIYHVFGLDLATGATVLQTLIPGTIGTGFNWTIEQERGALALHNGYVYVPFGGRAGDCGSYHGWVVGVPTNGSTTLAVYETPDIGIGIWTAGGVVVDDATGNVFAATGNGTGSGCNTVNQNDAVVRLSPTLALQDYFMPNDWQNNWCANDQDLGSASPLLISSGLLFQSGKWGGGFLMNPNSLGHVNGQLFPSPTNYTQAEVCFGNHSDATFGSFAYAAPFIYVECEGNGLVALNVNTGTPSFTPCGATCGAPNWSAGGGTYGPPIVAGGAVWVASNGGGLTAFNAATGAQVFQSAAFSMNRFSTPAEAGGQVFVASKTVIRTFNMQFNFTLTPLGGILTTGPGSSSWGASRADVFVGGTDLGAWQQTWNGTSWQSWQPLGGVITADPSAAAWGPNRIDLFVRGTDRALYHKWWDGTRWSGWERLGGILTAGPGAATQGSGLLDIVVRGTDNGLWHKWFDGAGWHQWEALGGVLTTDPDAVSPTPGRLDVVVRGTDNGLWHRYMDGSGWHPWEALGGVLTSAPTISSCAAGTLDAWVLGTDGGLWRKTFSGGVWGPWQSEGGQWTSSPAATCRPGTTTIDVYIRGTDHTLWQLGF